MARKSQNESKKRETKIDREPRAQKGSQRRLDTLQSEPARCVYGQLLLLNSLCVIFTTTSQANPCPRWEVRGRSHRWSLLLQRAPQELALFQRTSAWGSRVWRNDWTDGPSLSKAVMVTRQGGAASVLPPPSPAGPLPAARLCWWGLSAGKPFSPFFCSLVSRPM